MSKEKGKKPVDPGEAARSARSQATMSAFEAMLDKKTKCAGCQGEITREDRQCPKCSRPNEYWMH